MGGNVAEMCCIPKNKFLRLFLNIVFNFLYDPCLAFSVRSRIGPFAQPDFMQEAPSLPKTRSGKIMRRVLRKIAVGDRNLGDVSTMADESVAELLFSLRPKGA